MVRALAARPETRYHEFPFSWDDFGMSYDPAVSDATTEASSSRLLVHVLLHFMLAVRYRKNVVIASLLACGLLGGLYFTTATRYYGATAGMLMMQTGMDDLKASLAGQFTEQHSLMTTFENVVRSPKVIEGALERLRRAEDRIDLAGARREHWARILQANLSTSTIPTTNILQVSYRSKDPVVAVTVVNAVVDSYLDFLDKTHKGTAGEISRVLTQERVQLAAQLQQRQQELIEAKAIFGDLSSKNGSEIINPVIKSALFFTDELNAVQRRRIGLQATMAAIQDALRRGEDLQCHFLTIADSVGRELLMESFGLGEYHARIRAMLEEGLIRDRAELQAMQGRLGPAHPQMLARIEMIRRTEEYLRNYDERSNQTVADAQRNQLGPLLVHMVQQKLDETLSQEAALRVQFEASRAKAIELNGRLAALEVLEHDVARLRALNDALTNRIASIDLRQDGQEVCAAVIDQPTVNETPVSPRLARVAFIAIVLGLMVGLVIIYVLDVLDDRFRSIEDIERQLGVPVLSMVRQLPAVNAVGLEALQLYMVPNAAESEAFRTLRTALSLADDQSNRFVVTSAEPGDGKTTVMANLAVCYAQSGKKTLLIDADLRRPGLTDLMQMKDSDGLSNVLRGDTDVVTAATATIQASGMDKLDILPAGPRPTNPGELLAGSRLAELINWAGTLYDRILIDSPPTLATSDAAVLGRLVDGVILVVQPDKNRRRAVIRAVEGLLSLRIAVSGIVLNRVGADKSHDYYGYGYSYGYGYTRGYGYHTEEASKVSPSLEEGWGDPEPAEDAPRRPASPGIVPRRAA